ncbi:MAG: hypothetical protein JWO62_314 [Acidimicrobiaceae bacterium]|nr:hypothetical protein [Acidimicrobiaceae bacterium]
MVLPPGSVVRFRVIDPRDGRRGSSWSAETSRHQNDGYVWHREAAHMVKSSFHCDDPKEWHFSVMEAGQELRPDLPPYQGIIRDFVEVAPGWLHGLRITVDLDELRGDWEERSRARADIVDIPANPGVDAVTIDAYLTTPCSARFQPDQCAIWHEEIERIDGGRLVVVARAMNIDGRVREVYAGPIAEAREGMRVYGWDGTTPTRAVLYGPAEGFLREIEFAS